MRKIIVVLLLASMLLMSSPVSALTASDFPNEEGYIVYLKEQILILLQQLVGLQIQMLAMLNSQISTSTPQVIPTESTPTEPIATTTNVYVEPVNEPVGGTSASTTTNVAPPELTTEQIISPTEPPAELLPEIVATTTENINQSSTTDISMSEPQAITPQEVKIPVPQIKTLNLSNTRLIMGQQVLYRWQMMATNTDISWNQMVFMVNGSVSNAQNRDYVIGDCDPILTNAIYASLNENGCSIRKFIDSLKIININTGEIVGSNIVISNKSSTITIIVQGETVESGNSKSYELRGNILYSNPSSWVSMKIIGGDWFEKYSLSQPETLKLWNW